MSTTSALIAFAATRAVLCRVIEGRAPCEPQYGRRQSPAASNFSGKVDDGRSPVFGMFGYLFDIDRVTVVPQDRARK